MSWLDLTRCLLYMAGVILCVQVCGPYMGTRRYGTLRTQIIVRTVAWIALAAYTAGLSNAIVRLVEQGWSGTPDTHAIISTLLTTMSILMWIPVYDITERDGR